MTIHEAAYLEGFSKTAEAAGMSPSELFAFSKSAADGYLRPKHRWLNEIFDAYDDLDPMRRRAVMGGLATGLGTYLMSDGDLGARLLKSLAGGALGGAAIYGLDNAGVTDATIDLLRSGLMKLKTPAYSKYTGLHHKGQFGG